MGHERSVTRQKKRGGKWYNFDTSGGDAGKVLGNKKGYKTRREAENAARKRSKRTKPHKSRGWPAINRGK